MQPAFVSDTTYLAIDIRRLVLLDGFPLSTNGMKFLPWHQAHHETNLNSFHQSCLDEIFQACRKVHIARLGTLHHRVLTCSK